MTPPETLERNGVSPRVSITSEPGVYESDGGRIFDLIGAARGDIAAQARLERHQRELAAEKRTHPNRTPGQGGYFAPPGFDQGQFAAFPRPGQVLAAAVPNFPLPAGVQSVSVPRLTTGSSVSTETDGSADSQTDIADAELTSPVVVISGYSNVAIQLIDQSPQNASTEWALLEDASSAYDLALEQQLINGSGTGGQLTGLLNVSGTNSVSYTTATPSATGSASVPSMFASLGQLVAQTAQNRGTAQNGYFALSTSRAVWLASAEDASYRPLDLSNAVPNGNFDLLSYRTLLSDAMPRTINGSQEPIIFCRPVDCCLWQSEPKTSVMLDVLSGTLQARIQFRRYAAFVVRYPSSVSILTGTGTVPVSPF
jgi:HK97 family phage major capsid protein